MALADFLVVILSLLFAFQMSAQETNGTIVGRVRDAGGAYVTTAKVTPSNTGTHAQTMGAVLTDGSFTVKVTQGGV